EERKSVMRSFIDEPPVSTKAASALILYILEFYDGDEFDERACDCLRGIAGALSMGDDRRIS
ncbi:MAG TPA: hypothetical protein VFS91_03785, partial [Nitrobacter sp.]|nr:hypothetical protein [Nitrobacter sp.]